LEDQSSLFFKYLNVILFKPPLPRTRTHVHMESKLSELNPWRESADQYLLWLVSGLISYGEFFKSLILQLIYEDFESLILASACEEPKQPSYFLFTMREATFWFGLRKWLIWSPSMISAGTKCIWILMASLNKSKILITNLQ